jgi:Fe2+ transport system protein B
MQYTGRRSVGCHLADNWRSRFAVGLGRQFVAAIMAVPCTVTAIVSCSSLATRRDATSLKLSLFSCMGETCSTNPACVTARLFPH